MYALDGHTVHAKHTACAGPKMYCLYSKVGHGFINCLNSNTKVLLLLPDWRFNWVLTG